MAHTHTHTHTTMTTTTTTTTTMADTHEIEYVLVPNTKGKSDLWKHFSMHTQKKADDLIDADVAVCINGAIQLSNLQEAPQTCQHI